MKGFQGADFYWFFDRAQRISDPDVTQHTSISTRVANFSQSTNPLKLIPHAGNKLLDFCPRESYDPNKNNTFLFY